MSTEFDQDFIIERFDASPDPAALGGVLFAEEFDALETAISPAPPAAPEPPPALTDADLAAARAIAYQEGLRAGLEEAEGRARLAEEAASTALTQALADARDRGVETIRASAQTLSQTIMCAFASLLPEFSAQHGPAEAAGLVEGLLPMLSQQPRLAIRAHPQTLPALQRAVAAHAGEARISLTGNAALAEGDVTIDWQDGGAVRDTALLLAECRAALKPLGIDPAPRAEASSERAAQQVRPALAPHRAMEMADAN